MDKRKQENLRVKMNITTALLDLMHQKKLSDISITEIIQNAHVARASFYRNFTSKEDVLMVLVEDVLTYYHDTADYEAGEYFSYKNVLRAFQFFYFFRSYVLDLYEFGYGAMILEKLNQFHEEVAGTMPSSSLERYNLYIYIGALYNMAISWLRSGARESIENIAATFCRGIGITDIP